MTVIDKYEMDIPALSLLAAIGEQVDYQAIMVMNKGITVMAPSLSPTPIMASDVIALRSPLADIAAKVNATIPVIEIRLIRFPSTALIRATGGITTIDFSNIVEALIDDDVSRSIKAKTLTIDGSLIVHD